MASTQYEENASKGPATYGGTANVDQPKLAASEGEKDNCCVAFAKCWIAIIGTITMLFGFGLSAAALYLKFGYSNYSHFNESLIKLGVASGVWYLLGFGVVLSICAILLIAAGCNHDNASCGAAWKIILVVFTIILSILLVAEVISGIAVFMKMEDLAQPASIASKVNDTRTQAVTKLYDTCCVTFEPPYTGKNASVVDDWCKWPEQVAEASDTALKPIYDNDACKGFTATGKGVESCLCQNVETYGYLMGVFLAAHVKWVGIIAIVFGLLILCGLIASCVLICHHLKAKKDGSQYTPEDVRN